MGFYPVSFNKDAKNDSIFKHFPAELEVMNMHFDIFDLPTGAISMAVSEATPCQAFRFGKNVFALQFHFEVTETNATTFITEVTPEIVPGRLVQQPGEMLQKKSCCILNNRIFEKMLDEILLLFKES